MDGHCAYLQMPSVVARRGGPGEIESLMRIHKILCLAAALLGLLVLAGCPTLSPPPKGSPSELLAQGNKLAKEAEKVEGRTLQAAAFSDALEKYNGVVRKAPDSPEAAMALLATGKIQAGVPIGAKPDRKLKPVFETKAQNLSAARETFRRLLLRFDMKRSYQDLVDDYGRDNANRIQGIIGQADRYFELIGVGIDAENRGKPLYKIIDSLVRLTHKIPWFSYWFALVLITVIVKIITTPLTKAQFKSMREMQRLQPLIKDLQEKHKGDQMVMGEKIMQLYKEHGVNPLSGCLPILIQMPILFTLYYMIRSYEIQFANGTFLWIGWAPLVEKFSVPLMGGRPVWFTAANLAQPDLLLLVLYTISMIVSQRLSTVDPTQAEQQKMLSIMMPLMFFFLIGYLPSAFLFYWFTYNVLQTWQQYHVIHGVRAEEQVEAAPAPAPQRQRPSGRRRRRR